MRKGRCEGGREGERAQLPLDLWYKMYCCHRQEPLFCATYVQEKEVKSKKARNLFLAQYLVQTIQIDTYL